MDRNVFAALTIREVVVCAMGAFTDKHIKANAMMPLAVLIDKAFIFGSPFLPPSYDVSDP
jgi:hypothetical protein